VLVTNVARVFSWWFGAALSLATGYAHAETKPSKGQCVKANTEAQSFRREGKLEEAREQLKMCSSPKCPALVSADCIKRLDELEGAQPTVVFNVVDGQGRDLSDVTVTIDGKPLVDKLVGAAVAVELGEHTLTFSAPDRPPVTQKLVFREGEKSRIIRVTLASPDDRAPEEKAPEPEASVVAGEQKPPPHAAKSGGVSRRTIGFVVGGVGLAGLAVGGIFGVRAIQAKGRQLDNCETSTSCPDREAAAQAHEDARTNGMISTVAFIAGATATTVGLVLVLTDGSSNDEASPAALELAPSVGTTSAGLRLSGAF
jgi:hypothetical protein